MKRAAILSFSARGARLAEQIARGLSGDWRVELRAPRGDLAEVAAELFPAVEALIFVGACGIAVRAVGPLLESKARDPAVVVVDERGRHAISLLSGHIGGANALALRVAGIVGGEAVITIATDVNGRFSVDEWAARRGLRISDLGLAKRFSAEILRRDLPLWTDFPIEGNLPEGIFLAEQSDLPAHTCPGAEKAQAGELGRPSGARLGEGTPESLPCEASDGVCAEGPTIAPCEASDGVYAEGPKSAPQRCCFKDGQGKEMPASQPREQSNEVRAEGPGAAARRCCFNDGCGEEMPASQPCELGGEVRAEGPGAAARQYNFNDGCGEEMSASRSCEPGDGVRAEGMEATSRRCCFGVDLGVKAPASLPQRFGDGICAEAPESAPRRCCFNEGCGEEMPAGQPCEPSAGVRVEAPESAVRRCCFNDGRGGETPASQLRELSGAVRAEGMEAMSRRCCFNDRQDKEMPASQPREPSDEVRTEAPEFAARRCCFNDGRGGETPVSRSRELGEGICAGGPEATPRQCCFDTRLGKEAPASAPRFDLGVAVACREFSPFARTLRLVPRALHVGIGCKRGSSAERIASAVRAALGEAGLLPEAVVGVASIDVKRDEPGLLAYCAEVGVPVEFYAAEELRAVPGEFSASEFVRGVVGVDNVCERAAMLAAGPNARLLFPKRGANGVTVAIACADWRIRFP